MSVAVDHLGHDRRASGRARILLLGILLVATAGWLAAELPLGAIWVIIAGLVVATSIVARPQLGPLAVLVLVAIVPVETLFERDVGFLSGGLKVTDLLLFATLGAWLARRALHPEPTASPARSVRNLLLAFLALAVLGVVVGRLAGVPAKLSLLELRGLLALLLVFPLVDGVRRLRDVERGLAVFLLAVAIGAVVVIRDFMAGEGQVALYSDDATRINNLVFIYPLAGIAFAIALVAFERNRRAQLAILAVTAVSATALYFTLRRGAWILVLLTPVLVVGLLPRRARGGSVRRLLAMAAVAVVLVVAVNQSSETPIDSPLDTARERLLSIFETDEDVSSRHRRAEFDRAVELVIDHPATGIGLGRSFTFVSPLYSQSAEASNVPYTSIYVHNSYVWVALKLGLPALGLFCALILTVARRAYVGYRAATTPRGRRLLLGAFVTLVVVALESLSEPHLTFVGSTPLLVGLIALIELVPRLEREELELEQRPG